MSGHRLYVDGWIDPDGVGHDLRFPDWDESLCGKTAEGGQMTYTEVTCRTCAGDESLAGQL